MPEPNPRTFARELKKSNDSLSEVSLDELTEKVRSLRVAGMSDADIRTVLPTMFELKATVEDQISNTETSLDPNEIRIDDLPDQFDRDEWR